MLGVPKDEGCGKVNPGYLRPAGEVFCRYSRKGNFWTLVDDRGTRV